VGATMSRETREGRVPDLLLERYRLEEMLPDERYRLEQSLEQDAELRLRLEELERPTPRFAAAIRPSGSPRESRSGCRSRPRDAAGGSGRAGCCRSPSRPRCSQSSRRGCWPSRPGPGPAAEGGDRIKGPSRPCPCTARRSGQRAAERRPPSERGAAASATVGGSPLRCDPLARPGRGDAPPAPHGEGRPAEQRGHCLLDSAYEL
jgi:hypothetical protein